MEPESESGTREPFQATPAGEELPVAQVIAAPPGPRLPAAARALLYLIAIGIAAIGVQFIAILAAVLYLITTRGMEMTAAVKQLLGSDGASLPPPGVMALLSYLELGVALPITALFVVYLDRRPFHTLGFARVPGLWKHWLAGFLLEGIHFSALVAAGAALGWYAVSPGPAADRFLPSFLLAVLIWAPAAAFEEIAVRGYFLQTVESRYGTPAAVVSSSVVFALVHSLNPNAWHPMPMLGLFLAGVYLAVAYVATRQLWLPIAMHAAWNVFQGPIFGLPVSGMQVPDSTLRVIDHGPSLFTGGKFGPEAGLLVFLTTALMTLVVWKVAPRLLSSRVS